MSYYIMAFNKFAEFSGRSTRSEYWYFVLFNFLIQIGLSIILELLGDKGIGSAVIGLYALAVLIPSIAVTVRRLHDVGKSGWMILIWIIPIIGWIWLFVLTVLDSDPGSNEYGPNPKEINIGTYSPTPAATKDEAL